MRTEKHLALLTDSTGYGRCSLAVQLPVVSAMGVRCSYAPTAVLSNHTGYRSAFALDFMPYLDAYTAEWQKLGAHFDGILIGYTGSAERIDRAAEFIRMFHEKGTLVAADPCMADNGRLYRNCPEELPEKIRVEILPMADLVLPNLTEACLLTGEPYMELMDQASLSRIMTHLLALGPKEAVITGIPSGPQGEYVACLAGERGGRMRFIRQKRIGGQYAGTGDIFSAIVTADALKGVPLAGSVRKASAFIRRSIRETERRHVPGTDGVAFEQVLRRLR